MLISPNKDLTASSQRRKWRAEPYLQAENDLRGDSSRGGRFRKDMEVAEKSIELAIWWVTG